MKTLFSLLGLMIIVLASAGVVDAYHNSLLIQDCDSIQDRMGHMSCNDVQYLNSMMLEQRDELDVINGTLNNMANTINELTLLHDVTAPEDMVFTVTTDKESYVGNETMIVSGTLPDYGSSSVTFMLTSPSNMIVSISNAISDGNGNYSTTMTLGMSTMNESGTYTLVATYQGEKVQTTIEYSIN